MKYEHALNLKPHLLSLSILLGLTACSDNGSSSSVSAPSPTPTSSVSGTVTAPSGVIVKVSKPTLFEQIFPPAYAAIVGLEPVKNATVELIRIDDDGKQVGDVIASAPTSITGEYNITLPSGVSLAGNLVVRVRGQTTDMYGVALEQIVNIDPGSHYIYSKLVDSDLKMADLAKNHIVTLKGVIDELDLTAGNDLSETLAALDALAGYQMGQEVALISTTPGDAAQFEGTWHNGIYELSLHDHDDGSAATFYTSIEMASLSIESDSPSHLAVTLDAYEYNNGLFTFYQGPNSVESILYSETEFSTTPDVPEVLDVEVTTDGALIERLELDEHLGWDSGQGPEFAFRTLPSTYVAEPGGSDDVKIGINRELDLRFLTVDTDNDGLFDALDPSKKVGDEPSLVMDLFVKNGSGMTNTALNGNMGLVSFELVLNSMQNRTDVIAESSISTFDGSGAFTTAEGSEKWAQIVRTPTSVEYSEETPSDSMAGSYSVGDTGTVTFDVDGTELGGFASHSGDLLVASLIDRKVIDQSIVEYGQLVMMGVKLGDTPPSLAGSTYKLYPMELGFTANGGTEVLTFSNPSSMTFDDSGAQATLEGQVQGIVQNSTFAQSESPVEESETFQMAVNVNPDSSTTLSSDDGTFAFELDGFVSHDGSRILLSLKAIEEEGTSNAYHGLGFVLAVKQN